MKTTLCENRSGSMAGRLRLVMVALCVAASPVALSEERGETRTPAREAQEPDARNHGLESRVDKNRETVGRGLAGDSGNVALTPQRFVTFAAHSGMKEVQLSEIALRKTQDSDVRRFAQRMVSDHTAANEQLRRLAQSKGLTLPSTNLMNQGGAAGNAAGAIRPADIHTPTTTPLSRPGFEREVPGADRASVPTATPRADGTAAGPGLKATTEPVLRQDADRSSPVLRRGSGPERDVSDPQAVRTNSVLPDAESLDDMHRYHQRVVQHLEGLSGRDFDRAYMMQMAKDHEKAVARFEAASARLEDAELRKFATDTLPTLREHRRHAQEMVSTLGANTEVSIR